MNKYEEAFNVIETILHLMCGEEREDNYKPSHDEMVNSMEDFKELVERSTPQKLLYNGEYVSFFTTSPGGVKQNYKTNIDIAELIDK